MATKCSSTYVRKGGSYESCKLGLGHRGPHVSQNGTSWG